MRRQFFLRVFPRYTSKSLRFSRHIPANRFFHASSKFLVVKPFLLADIGEGEFRELRSLGLFNNFNQESENVRSSNGS